MSAMQSIPSIKYTYFVDTLFLPQVNPRSGNHPRSQLDVLVIAEGDFARTAARTSCDGLHLGATGSSTDTETLQLLEDAVRGALEALRIGASEKAPEMVAVLLRFDIQRTSDSMTVEGSISAAIIRDLMAKQMAVAMKPRCTSHRRGRGTLGSAIRFVGVSRTFPRRHNLRWTSVVSVNTGDADPCNRRTESSGLPSDDRVSCGSYRGGRLPEVACRC